jgi:hypothetical protein
MGVITSSDCVKLNNWLISLLSPLLSAVAIKQKPAKRCRKIRKRDDLYHLYFEGLLLTKI